MRKVQILFGKIWERYVDLGKQKYFLGDKFTLADIIATIMVCNITDMLKFEATKEIAPNLFELIQRVSQNELKEFYEKYYIKK